MHSPNMPTVYINELAAQPDAINPRPSEASVSWSEKPAPCR